MRAIGAARDRLVGMGVHVADAAVRRDVIDDHHVAGDVVDGGARADCARRDLRRIEILLDRRLRGRVHAIGRGPHLVVQRGELGLRVYACAGVDDVVTFERDIGRRRIAKIGGEIAADLVDIGKGKPVLGRVVRAQHVGPLRAIGVEQEWRVAVVVEIGGALHAGDGRGAAAFRDLAQELAEAIFVGFRPFGLGDAPGTGLSRSECRPRRRWRRSHHSDLRRLWRSASGQQQRRAERSQRQYPCSHFQGPPFLGREFRRNGDRHK